MISPSYIIVFVIGLFYSILVFINFLFSFLIYGKGAAKGAKYRTRPEILNDEKYGNHKFVHLNDVTVHCVENGDPSKDLVLFVHGYPEFWFSWRHQLTSQLASKFRLVAIDLRGYGDTDKPIGAENYKMQYLVDDIKGVIEKLGYEKCSLVSHDWGGAVCWAFAAKYPELVDRLAVLNCPHPAAFRQFMRQNRSQFFKSWYMFFFQVPWFPEWITSRRDLATLDKCLVGKYMGVKKGMISNEELEAFKYVFSKPGALSGPINFYRAMFRYPNSLPGIFKIKIHPKVLLIHGDRDRVISKEIALLTKNYCLDFTLRFVPDASHWVQQDAPDVVNNMLDAFLSDQTIPSS